LIAKVQKNILLVTSTAVIGLFALTTLLNTNGMYYAIEKLSLGVRNYFGFFYLYLGLGCVLLLLIVALSPIGKKKLGKKKDQPEHSLWSWVAMLYSAGMGAGILLRAVQEPVFMQQYPPYDSPNSPEILALEFTFYQWGFTAWAFYGLFAMVMGYALFVKKRNVRISSTLASIISHKGIKNGIDSMTIITTVFGLVAAIGLGTAQISGGLHHVFDLKTGITIPIFLAVLISGLAFISVWKGVNRGIKLISKLNIIITLLLLFFVFFTSDMKHILYAFGTAMFAYLIDFIPLSIAYGSYNPGITFLTDWTFYYWAFWLAWAPFTGIFIARISRGRTLRQILLGVLLIPSLGTFFWFSVFGTSAFQLIEGWGRYTNEFGNVFSSIFIFFENYPLASLLNLTTIFLLISFLVTSVDSAVYVLSMFTDKGKKTPSKQHRLLWSIIVLFTTIAVILLGNAKPNIDVLTAVQKLLIITSLPFAFFMILVTAVFFWEYKKK